MPVAPALAEPLSRDIADVDLVELYFERGWTDGLPVVPPTQDKVDAVVAALGGDPAFVECEVAPRWGSLTREVHSVTDHHCNDPEGILDTMCSAMSTIASNTAVPSGHCAIALGLEHGRTIAKHGWTRTDIKSYLWLNSGNRFDAHSRGHRYGKVYNRNLPKWYKREPDSRIP